MAHRARCTLGRFGAACTRWGARAHSIVTVDAPRTVCRIARLRFTPGLPPPNIPVRSPNIPVRFPDIPVRSLDIPVRPPNAPVRSRPPLSPHRPTFDSSRSTRRRAGLVLTRRWVRNSILNAGAEGICISLRVSLPGGITSRRWGCRRSSWLLGLTRLVDTRSVVRLDDC